jgi:cation:H+ antiporter
MAEILPFAFGLAALVLGADVLVRGAARLALGWGLSPLVIGLTLVAFGTSAPELAIGLDAGLRGHAELALGNVVGSNVFNLLGILGLAALIRPLAVDLHLLRRGVPLAIAGAVLVLLLSLDGRLGPGDGTLLVGALALHTLLLVLRARRAAGSEDERVYATELQGAATSRPALNLAMVVAGLALLVVGAHALVDSAASLARLLGVSELVVGLTVLAVGGSLPELATAVTASLRGERDIAVGNVIGSCSFNVLGCLGLTALLAPDGLPVPPAVARFDLWVMVAATIALLPMAMSGRLIARWEGVVLLSYYGAYLAYLVLAARRATVLPDFSAVMLAFVLPLALVTLVVATLKPPR